MDPLFLSYRRLDGADDVTELASALRFRGVPVWRDLDNLNRGHPTEDEVRRAISQECGGVACYVTPRFLDSEFIWKVEVPVALTRKGTPGELFPVVPIFAGVKPEGLSLRKPYGEVMAALAGEVVSSEATDGDRRTAMIATASTLLRSLLERSCAKYNGTERSASMALVTRQAVVPRDQVSLDIDWRVAFVAEGPASPASWDRDLLPALRDVKTALVNAIGAGSIALGGNAHLSAAIALGHIFSSPTGFQFEIEQRTEDGSIGRWRSAGDLGSADLDTHELPGSVEAEDVLVQVSLSRDVRHDVENWLSRSSGLRFRRRLHIQPRGTTPNRSFVRDDTHARGIAKYIAERVMEARRMVARIHLVIAAPWTIAVFLGQQLNACGPIQVYEHDKSSGTYTQACVLA